MLSRREPWEMQKRWMQAASFGAWEQKACKARKACRKWMIGAGWVHVSAGGGGCRRLKVGKEHGRTRKPQQNFKNPSGPVRLTFFTSNRHPRRCPCPGLSCCFIFGASCLNFFRPCRPGASIIEIMNCCNNRTSHARLSRCGSERNHDGIMQVAQGRV